MPKEKEVISEYFRKLAKRGHAVTKKKYGPDFYKKIGKKGGRPKAKKPLRKSKKGPALD